MDKMDSKSEGMKRPGKGRKREMGRETGKQWEGVFAQ